MLRAIVEVYATRVAEVAEAIAQELGATGGDKGITGRRLMHFREAIITLDDYAFEARESAPPDPPRADWRVRPDHRLELARADDRHQAVAGARGWVHVVLKPSEFTPLSAIVLAEILHEAGVPKGVFNLVTATVRRSATRSRASWHRHGVLHRIDARGHPGRQKPRPPSVKRVSQELGGKSANVVLPDADLAAAATSGVMRDACPQHRPVVQCATRMLVPEQPNATKWSRISSRSPAEGPRWRSQSRAQPWDRYPTRPSSKKCKAAGIGTGRRRNRRHRRSGSHAGHGQAATSSGLRCSLTSTADDERSPARKFRTSALVIPYKDVAEAVDSPTARCTDIGGYVYRPTSQGYAVAAQLRTGMVFLNGASTDAGGAFRRLQAIG